MSRLCEKNNDSSSIKRDRICCSSTVQWTLDMYISGFVCQEYLLLSILYPLVICLTNIICSHKYLLTRGNSATRNRIRMTMRSLVVLSVCLCLLLMLLLLTSFLSDRALSFLAFSSAYDTRYDNLYLKKLLFIFWPKINKQKRSVEYISHISSSSLWLLLCRYFQSFREK